MIFVAAWFRKHFNAPVTKFVVLRGKRILVDADFADRRLGRELSASKSVDVNLAAIRAGRRACQRLQFGLQLVGIVRERFEVLTLDNERTGV